MNFVRRYHGSKVRTLIESRDQGLGVSAAKLDRGPLIVERTNSFFIVRSSIISIAEAKFNMYRGCPLMPIDRASELREINCVTYAAAKFGSKFASKCNSKFVFIIQ